MREECPLSLSALVHINNTCISILGCANACNVPIIIIVTTIFSIPKKLCSSLHLLRVYLMNLYQQILSNEAFLKNFGGKTIPLAFGKMKKKKTVHTCMTKNNFDSTLSSQIKQFMKHSHP